MLLIGTRNTAEQDLAVNSLIDFGSVYRRFDKRNCGVRTFEVNGTTISLQSPGIYHLTSVITFTAPAAGDVVYQLVENGTDIVGATSTVSVTTADTETNTVSLDFYILVDSNTVLNSVSALKNISIANAGVSSTVTNIVTNIEKVV